jgi:hypothetical protein
VKMASILVLSGVLCAGGIAAGVQLKDAATSVSGGHTAAVEEPEARIISSYSDFAGSDANAQSLVAGLRHGSEITLAVPARSGQPGTATRFTAPTRPLDYGDVRIALALARTQLAQLGIDRPTPAQIKAVLAGEGIATRVSGQATTPFLLPGVLQLRAGGIGWARIANMMGVTLEPAMKGNSHPAGVMPPPISSGWITTSVAAAAPKAAVIRQPAPARRPAAGEAEPEIRRSGARVVAAAESVAKAGNAAMPVREGANSTIVVTRAVVEAPGAADPFVHHEEVQTAD